MSFRGRGAALLGWALSLRALPAGAEEGHEAVSFAFEPSACGTQGDFVEQVRKRTTKFKLVSGGGEVRNFSVRIDLVPGGGGESSYTATLSIASADSEKLVRRVEGSSCEELLDAVALMTALAIDPTAPAQGGEEPPAEPEPGLASRSGDDADTTAPDKLRAEKATKPSKQDKSPQDAAPQPHRAALRMGLGVHGAIDIGATEAPLYGGVLDLALGWGAGIFSPEGRLWGLYSAGARVEGELGTAEFQLYGGGIEVCPLRLGSETVSFQPCGAGMLGGLSGKGGEISEAQRQTKPYATLGLGGRLGVLVHPHASIEARLGAHFPSRRDRFLLGEEVVSRASAVTGLGTLGLTFWL